MLLLSTISQLNRVGKAVASRLQLLGIETVEDLLLHFPFRYEDYTNVQKIANLRVDESATVQGTIVSISGRSGFRSVKHIIECVICDGESTMSVNWFNQPYLLNLLSEESMISVCGKVRLYKGNITFTNPTYEKITELSGASSGIHTGGITPIYGVTANITQKQMRFLVSQALQCVTNIKEFLPPAVIDAYNLCGIHEAVTNIHFPEDEKRLDSAKRRLKFQELFILQLQNQLLRKELAKSKAINVATDLERVKTFLNGLSFSLTQAQKKATWRILQDMNKETPMNRLLQGDVGSGKTVVAGIAALNVISGGYQCAFMAPTEILARQHFETCKKFYSGHDVTIALLTHSYAQINTEGLDGSQSQTKRRSKILELIASGGVDVLIGTHALIEKDVNFSRLALVIVDEQHRFGVRQRKKLKEKMKEQNMFPHLLSMTATPIPRTLALTLYGDLSISVINEMPKGRLPIETNLVRASEKNNIYAFVASEMQKGRQCYVICPLIEESDTLGVTSVKQEYEKLRKIFPQMKIAMMHGKLRSNEKETLMRDFSENRLHMLVSTSVVEVGVDVPNATIMLIEGAERFGLSQLHQFRGRIGRGSHQSHCFLIAGVAGTQSYQRLKIMTQSTDGFYISKKDLEIRGPGEVFGNRQSGFPEFKIASFSDSELLSLTSDAATEFVNRYSLQDYPELAEKVYTKLESLHLE